MARIEFNTAFRTDKAGRAANQDNGFCVLDLKNQDSQSGKEINTDRTIPLGEYGALFVVADGMGGMNAGEKASELVVAGMQREFANVSAQNVATPDDMAAFMNSAIVNADNDVKQYARKNPNTRGMGSTIVALWIFKKIAVAAWVGDSRIYRFNPSNGLVRLSHDHSYVQNLVDTGRLPEHMAFNHPDSNIITRSLGDNGEPAKAETRIYKVYDLDEFLLCSDGLCGLLTDEEIEEVMRANTGSSKHTLDALWKAADKKGFTDNCTIEVICVTGELPEAKKGKCEGYPEIVPPSRNNYASNARVTTAVPENVALPNQSMPAPPGHSSYRNTILYLIIGLVVACGAVGVYYLLNKDKDKKAEVVTVDDENDDINNFSSEVKKLADDYNALSEQLAEYNDRIPSSFTQRIKDLQNRCSNLENQNLSDKQRTIVEELKLHCTELLHRTESEAFNEPRSIPTQANPAIPSGKKPEAKRSTKNREEKKQDPKKTGGNIETHETPHQSSAEQSAKPKEPKKSRPMGPTKEPQN